VKSSLDTGVEFGVVVVVVEAQRASLALCRQGEERMEECPSKRKRTALRYSLKAETSH
jgi:hypothetical protein